MLRTFFLVGIIACSLAACDPGSRQPVNTGTEERWEPTKGIITEVQEVDTNDFRIIDERVVENKADSRIIAHYLDGTTDTMTVEEAKLAAGEEATETSNTTHQQRHYYGGGYGFFGVLRGGLMGYYLGRSMSVPPSAGVYMDQRTYNRVADNAGKTIQQTARRTTVSRPSKSRSGYGSRRSTRSYGG